MKLRGKAIMMTYADGSGNTYEIRDDQGKTLEYIPVKPAFSSSGIYDGGTYVKKEISEGQFAQIRSVLTCALSKTAIHSMNRTMGSGFISIQEAGKLISCNLSPGSPEQVAIESILKNLLQRE